MNAKNLLGWVVRILHTLINPVILYLLFTSNRLVVILAILSYKFFILFQWYVYGDCILVPIENYLLDREPKKYNNGENMSVLSETMSKLLNVDVETIGRFTLILNPIIVFICIYRIYRICGC